jgi:hypothetical protein
MFRRGARVQRVAGEHGELRRRRGRGHPPCAAHDVRVAVAPAAHIAREDGNRVVAVAVSVAVSVAVGDASE